MTGDTDETDAADDPADGPPADDAGDAPAAEAPADGPSATDATGDSEDAVETGDRTGPDAVDASGGTDGSGGSDGTGGSGGTDGPGGAGDSDDSDDSGGSDGSSGGDGAGSGGGDGGSGSPGGPGGGGDDPYRRDVDPERVEYLAAELADLQEDVEGLESRVTDRTVHRDDIEAELRRYVRARQRRGHATGWGPYLVLLYGVFMTLGAFYYLGGVWAILAMIIVWLSTLGLYVVMAVLSTGITVTRRVAALRNVVRRFR